MSERILDYDKYLEDIRPEAECGIHADVEPGVLPPAPALGGGLLLLPLLLALVPLPQLGGGRGAGRGLQAHSLKSDRVAEILQCAVHSVERECRVQSLIPAGDECPS